MFESMARVDRRAASARMRLRFAALFLLLLLGAGAFTYGFSLRRCDRSR